MSASRQDNLQNILYFSTLLKDLVDVGHMILLSKPIILSLASQPSSQPANPANQPPSPANQPPSQPSPPATQPPSLPVPRGRVFLSSVLSTNGGGPTGIRRASKHTCFYVFFCPPQTMSLIRFFVKNASKL